MAENNGISLELPAPTLDPTTFEEATLTPIVAAPEETSAVTDYLSDANLTEEEKKAVEEFSQKINIKDTNVILQYGAACQEKIASFSDTTLENVRTKDLGEVGDMITNLVVELKGFSIDSKDEKQGLFGLFKKSRNSFAKLQERYDTASNSVDKISEILKDHQNTLFKDIVMFDQMYDVNLAYFKELSMYIIAGKKRLEEERNTTLKELKAKAEASGLAEDAQAANDFANLCERFEKKLYDLQLTREISIQMAPEIRLIQNGDTLMVEKIQTTINNTIPLWKNQMVLALGMAHSKEAMEAQKEVSDLTNELLQKNAETLQMGTIEIAKESERGIVDIETVEDANRKLIETLDEVLKIQEEGRQKRMEAENTLGKIETELRQKLLEVKG
ncbi:MAG: toxic anion resistance protein [Oscillospiraceae bacterium]|nr:toxic anion resistance protein [Oscillospiraceae bacterium]MBR4928954.1 toxic anion resistance protein [Oscillospiraceae bacterium]MBR5045375.1 toxic anion resistance protein [Oscillospiraceae bacterium]